jgi:hypothetical protein
MGVTVALGSCVRLAANPSAREVNHPLGFACAGVETGKRAF